MTHDDCEWRQAFLDSLRVTGNVSAAARLVGKARASLYRMRRNDPDFAAAWQDALEEYTPPSVLLQPHGWLMTPAQHGTDGFFMTVLRRAG